MLTARVWTLIALLLLAPATSRALPWIPVATGTTAHLYGVAWRDGATCVAVGDAGAILRSTDAGASWAAVASPVGDPLRAVAFHGATGIAVGIAGRVIRSTDGGASWSTQARPTTRALYSVCMGDSADVITGEEGSIFVSTDGGLTWTRHLAGTASILFGVAGAGHAVVAVGGQGAITMSTDDGQGWGLTVLGGQSTFFYGASFATATTGWAVGASAGTGSVILKTTAAGFVWTAESAPTANTLTGVSFTSLDAGTAVGFTGTILRTTDGGANWALQSSGTALNLNAVAFRDDQTGIAVGDSGTILRTLTGGTTSVPRSPASPALRLGLVGRSPFPGVVELGFELPVAGRVRLAVFDVRGARVATLADGALAAGPHTAHFDGAGFGSGVYFARLEFDEGGAAPVVAAQRLVLRH